MDLGAFREFGVLSRRRIYAGRRPNAARNKCISYASALRDAVNSNRSKVMEVLAQLSVYTDLPLPSGIGEAFVEESAPYKEAGMMVALMLLSEK